MYYLKILNYKKTFKKFIFLFLIFFFINNLIALKAGRKHIFGNSEKSIKLESIFNQNIQSIVNMITLIANLIYFLVIHLKILEELYIQIYQLFIIPKIYVNSTK